MNSNYIYTTTEPTIDLYKRYKETGREKDKKELINRGCLDDN